MPLLTYCIVANGTVAQPQLAGVDDAPIDCVEHSGLVCFVSQRNETGPPHGETIRESAITFHRVLEQIFRQTAIIPFRFPTIFPDRAEVTAHLEEHFAEYLPALGRLRTMVQMEMRLRLADSHRWEPAAAAAPRSSGTEYLQKSQARRVMLEAVADDFRMACAELTRGWKQRDSTEGIRCFALIERATIKDFQSALARVSLRQEVAARLSGPWPATQFLKEE